MVKARLLLGFAPAGTINHPSLSGMRVLLINQFFYPSSAATSQLLTDLACHLAKLDHDVMVICSAADADAKTPERPLPGISVRRVPGIPFHRGRYKRLLSYASFFLGALWSALTVRRPDVVVTLTTPPLLSVIGTVVRKLRGVRHVSWEMDVYPDIAVELGVLRENSQFTRWIRRLADWSRRNADAVVGIGDDMRDILIASGLSAQKVVVVHNWADSTEIRPLPFPHGTLSLLYSGNLGLAHDVSTLEAALQACNVSELAKKIHFTFSGGGIRRLALENFAHDQKLSNVSFQGYCSRNEVNESLAQCHVGLVSQHPRVTGSAVSSKLYGILAAGRPVIYIGPAGTTPARILRRFDCGWHILPGDDGGLVELLRRLEKDRDPIYAAGRRARQALLDHYDRPIALDKLTRVIIGV